MSTPPSAAPPIDALNLCASLAADERDRPALVTESGALSFGDLARGAAALAGHLERRGLRCGSRAAFVAAPSVEGVLAIVALAAMGVTLVPIHPRLSAAEARVVVDVARADHVLDPEEIGRAAREAVSASTLASGQPSRFALPASMQAPPPFAIVSTSGTTGRPKGAVLSRRAFLASAEASAKNLGWGDGDRWLLCMPLAHVGGLSIVTRCLAARRTMVLLPRFEAGLVLDAIGRHRVTLLSVVPTMLHALIEADAGGALASPRALLLGGAAAPPALLDACAARRIRALTTYGLTEACSQVTTQAPRDPSIRLAGSGPALDGFELRIAGDDGAALPVGAAGRILIAGPALFDGYLTGDGLALDPARVATSPSSSSLQVASRSAAPSAARFFDTGDIGELDERGHLHVHVRRTDLVVTGGENVYPVEVEQALERCPGVRRCLVIGVPDERWGQIVAAVVEVDPVRLSSADAAADLRRTLADLCAASLAPHKRPRRLALVEGLPLTASGKVDRKDALARYAAVLEPFPLPRAPGA